MARRQARFTPREVEVDPRLQDESALLWPPDLGAVPRALLTSAVRCFAANGFHATTTRDIAEGVGLSPAALYVHFPAKEAALHAIVRAGHEHALAVLTPQPGDPEDPEGRLRTMVSRYTAWHARCHVAARVCQYELNGLTPEHYAEVLDLRHRTNAVFREAVARGVATGSFDAPDVNRLVRGLLSLSIDLVRWYRTDGADSPDDVGAFYADLAIRMVAARTVG